MRRVCISGFSDVTKQWANFQPQDCEIWAMNEAHIYLQPHALARTTLWFQIHPRDWKEQAKRDVGMESKIPENTFARGLAHVEFLQKWTKPILMQQHFDDIPASIPYPLDEIGARYGKDGFAYLTTSPAYMLAYALYEDDLAREAGDNSRRIRELRMSGIELRVGRELYLERPCYEYYLGRIMERGIRVVWPPKGTTLLAGPIYAKDAPVVLAGNYKGQPVPVFVANEKGFPEVQLIDSEQAKKMEEHQIRKQLIEAKQAKQAEEALRGSA